MVLVETCCQIGPIRDEDEGVTSAPALMACESTLWKTSELANRSFRRRLFSGDALWPGGFGGFGSSASVLTALFFTAVMVLAALSDDSCLFVAGRWSSPSTVSFTPL